ALARRGDVSIVFFGDSLTDHWRDTGQAIWAKHFEPLGAVNFGIGSDGTQNVLWRVQNGELPPDGAEVVVLLIGTVNLNPPDAVHLSATGYQIWAEAMLGSLRDLLARDAPGRV